MVKGILVNRKSDELMKSQLKMEHADLVAEMQTVENLPTHERLQLARLRRTQQLKVARQKEKEWLKLQRAKGNTSAFNGGTNTSHHFRSGSTGSANRHISFENSVVLLEAASRNDMQEVAELLQRGITPDAANEDGLTALHQCCIDNNVEMLKLLLDFGANVDAQDSDKWTPLHAAATCGHLDLVRILIEHGANLLAVNTDGNMPYDLCDDENTLDFIEAEMSKRGVTQELIDETRSSTEREMLKDLMEVARNGGDLEEPDYQGATPLHIAAANGYVRVVEFLLEMHVNVDAMDKDLWSPVHAAACWGHLEVLEMLAQCGADLNVKNKDDETPSDICEDPEIRERIEQLKTEQESKRLAEAQRRRVRRSQSNNTRAQSVRRTSLRDKTLTTKKDAVEEARLRLQAQEVFITPVDGKSKDPNGMPANSTSNANSSYPMILNHSQDMSLSTDPAAGTDVNGHTTATTVLRGSISSHHKNTINNNNDRKSLQQQQQQQTNLVNQNGILLSHVDSTDAGKLSSLSSTTTTTTTTATSSATATHTYTPRRPPDGRENDELQLNAYKSGAPIDGEQQQRSAAAAAVMVTERNLTASTAASDTVQVQSSKEAANGKINVQVTVLVDTTSTLHHHSNPNLSSNSISNLNSNSGATQADNNIFSGATLANLKKQRSLSRTSVLNCENGSVLGAATINHNNNSIHGDTSGPSLSGTATANSQSAIGHPMHPPAYMDMNNGFGSQASRDNSAYSSLNKFSGVTSDVVSDSTSSKKCCTIM